MGLGPRLAQPSGLVEQITFKFEPGLDLVQMTAVKRYWAILSNYLSAKKK
jgi:hypothetical protein